MSNVSGVINRKRRSSGLSVFSDVRPVYLKNLTK